MLNTCWNFQNGFVARRQKNENISKTNSNVSMK